MFIDAFLIFEILEQQKRMKSIYYTLLAGTLFLGSCKREEAYLAENIPILKEHNVFEDKPYSVPFKTLEPEFILEKGHMVEEFFHKHIKKDPNFSGSFLVAKNGQILYEEYQGFSNKAKNEVITANTPIHVASVGKVITAVTTLRLIDEGFLYLDQSVSSILPEFPYEDISVRMLLNHRSGLRYYGYYDKIWDQSKTITNQDVLDVISTKKVNLDFLPNKKFAYSNTNYVILALIVEKITGDSFKKAVKDLVFDPLQMTHSFVFDDITKKNDVCQSYSASNRQMHWDYMDGTYGDKNIYTNPRDMLKLDTALYSDEFLSADLKKQMTKGYSYETKGKRNYGLGLRLIEMDNGHNYTFHNGWWRGNTTSYIRLEQDSVSIILFANKYSKLSYKTIDLAHHFGDYKVGNLDL